MFTMIRSKNAIATFILTLMCLQCLPVSTYGWSIDIGKKKLSVDLKGISYKEINNLNSTKIKAPSAPKRLKVFDNTNTYNGYVLLEWKANPSKEEIEKYEIYCNSEKIGEAQKSWRLARYIDYKDHGKVTNCSECGAITRGFTNGRYNYTVRACNKEGLCSNFSDVAPVIVSDNRWYKKAPVVTSASFGPSVGKSSFAALPSVNLTKLKDKVSSSTGSLWQSTKEFIKAHTK